MKRQGLGRRIYNERMAIKDELHHFLLNRRARITPEMAGIPVYGEKRRVKGLRREEVALLAGISVEYYKRLERGKIGDISEGVFAGLVHALQLDSDEQAYLRSLILATQQTGAQIASSAKPQNFVRPAIPQMLEAMTYPAYLRNNRFDILAVNDAARALYSPVFEFSSGTVPNIARFLFLSPEAPKFFKDYEDTTDRFAGVLRAEVGKNLRDAELIKLVEELKVKSNLFAQKWDAYDVTDHCSGPKTLNHPLIGEITLNYEAFDLPTDPGQRINVYTCEAGSAEARALELLDEIVNDRTLR